MRLVVIIAPIATALILCGCGDSSGVVAPPFNEDEPPLEWTFDPPETATQAVSVSRVETQIAEERAEGWWYGYQFDIRNGTNFTIEADVSILWLSVGDEEVHRTELRNLQIAPLTTRTVERFAYIPKEAAVRIVRPEMTWTWTTLF